MWLKRSGSKTDLAALEPGDVFLDLEGAPWLVTEGTDGSDRRLIVALGDGSIEHWPTDVRVIPCNGATLLF